MANEWAGVLHQNMPKYVRGLENLCMRNRIFLAMLKQRGRFKYNESSHECIWHVRMSQPDVEPYEDGSVMSYQRHDPARKISLDWRGYVSKDVMTKKERMMNGTDVQIYNRYDQIANGLRESMTDTFGSEVFIDGNASGNEARMHGIDSFTGYNTCLVTDKVAEPNDTYATRNTNLQDEGGSWSSNLATPPNATIATDWPSGSGTSDYDFFSPKLVNVHHDWGSGTPGWKGNGEYIIRRTVAWLRMTGGQTGRPDLALLNQDWLAEYKDDMSAKQRIVVPHKRAEDLGFEDSVKQEGIVLYDDFEVPADEGFVLNIDKIIMASLGSTLFFSDGPNWRQDDLSWRWVCGYFGNMKFQPKYHAKLKDFRT